MRERRHVPRLLVGWVIQVVGAPGLGSPGRTRFDIRRTRIVAADHGLLYFDASGTVDRTQILVTYLSVMVGGDADPVLTPDNVYYGVLDVEVPSLMGRPWDVPTEIQP